mgnify:CR=1 FL=1|tara:strand:- start:225 stop:611 length:387 start_codon:yes stop_codon:yes gene_type:complete
MPLIGRKKLSAAMQQVSYVETNDNIKGVYLAGLTNIVAGTPADTGRARNNWFLTVGSPSGKDTTIESKSGSNSNNQLDKMPDRVLNKKLYYTNNLDYIVGLEMGTSLQAPNGWVRKTLGLMMQKIKQL